MPFLLLWVFSSVAAINLLQMADGPGDSSPVASVTAVEGGEAALPCNLQPAQPGDSVYLVLWYRRDDKTPIYSFDSRASSGGGPGVADLWSEPKVFGTRAEFQVGRGGSAVLSVSDVLKRKDEGEYTCRVDFRQSPTKYHRMRLSVIVPPLTPLITEPGGRKVQGSMLGPLQQGEPLTLDCKVQGGMPPPSVHWYRDSTLIDSTDLVASDTEMQNRLVLEHITRQHLGARYRCLAINNNLTSPAEAHVQVDVYFPPLGVKISTGGSPFAVGRDYTVRCITWGSNPPATITWGRTNGRRASNKHLTVINETSRWNFTESVMLYHPRPVHHGQSLQCRASNPAILRENIMEDDVKLEVFFPPSVSLHIGKALNLNDLEEGDDVYFECSIQANPAAYKVTWLHNGLEVVQRPDKQMFISNQSLVLQKVSREQAGNYSCHASNVEGDAESKPVTLTIMYVPVCDADQPVVYGVSENETVAVSCRVHSYPKAGSFTWSFNNSLTSSLLPPSSYTSIPGSSTISYTPHSHMEFGTLLCWGTNMVGNQATSQPCVFHIIPTSSPDPPRRCAVANRTSSSLTILCIAGYGGGLPQQLHLNLVSSQSQVVANLSSPVAGEAEPSGGRGSQEEVVFTVERLPPLTSFRALLFSSNSRGRSQEKVLEANTRRLEMDQGEAGSVVSETGRDQHQAELPLLAVVFLAAALTLLALGAALLTATSVRRRRSQKQEQGGGRDRELQGHNKKMAQSEVNGSHGNNWSQVSLEPGIGPDKSPDIIKDTKGDVSHYGRNYERAMDQRQIYREESLGVSSPPDGGFPSHPTTQYSLTSLQYGTEQYPLPPGQYPVPSPGPYPSMAGGSTGQYPSLHFTGQYSEQYYSSPQEREYYREGGEGDYPAPGSMERGPQLPLCSEALVSRAGGLRTPLLEDDRESCV